MMMTTCEPVETIRTYNLSGESDVHDPYVLKILERDLDVPTLRELKAYARSGYDITLHLNSLMQYRRLNSDEAAINDAWRNNANIRHGLQKLEDWIAPVLQTVKVFDITQINKVNFIPSSSAGWGYDGKKKRDCHPEAMERARRALKHFVRHGANYRFAPCMAFARTHVSKVTEPKIRHVWGYPFHSTLIEGLVAQPLLEAFHSEKTPIYIGKNLFLDMPADVNILDQEDAYVYGLDFSRFDSSVCSYAIRSVFDVMQRHLRIGDEHETVWRYITTNFLDKRVAMPNGTLYRVTTGVPSGSMFTNFIDSCVNAVLMEALFDYFQMSDVKMFYVHGDDSIFFSDRKVELEDLAAFFAQFNMKLNIDKSVLSSQHGDAYFLGHMFRGSTLMREDFVLLSLALYPEKPILSVEESVSRLAGLLLDSCLQSRVLFDLYRKVCAEFHVKPEDLIVNRPPSIEKMLYVT